ncbi:amino acid ABC transporter permease [Microbacterium sp. TNHR37B]|uniref:amino acid ABC transporter permease n=1 Tax=Microbacterium sp. TNHR37B TaxID=1775956 RepID=UPI0007B1C31F|nr:amino acid ABC transporter permease [Microbacterium sp. TNHR37B]KZE89856.1 putative amino-acid permease protein YxeN [Microbacterium sp. TNHR37B]
MTFDVQIFLQQVFSQAFLNGAFLSISVAVLSQIAAIVLGFLLALATMGKNAVLRAVARVYIWLFRAIPALLVLLLLWNAAPQLIPAFRQSWYSPFLAAVIGLALTEAAFMAEIIRSAMQSVDDGQALAARALGMKPVSVLFKVTLPQAIRVAIPPTGNEFIAMVKYTSLASVISLRELLTTAQLGVSTTFRYAEYYAAATVYYLVIVSVLMILQNRLERRYRWTSPKRKRRSAVNTGSIPTIDLGGVAVPAAEQRKEAGVR